MFDSSPSSFKERCFFYNKLFFSLNKAIFRVYKVQLVNEGCLTWCYFSSFPMTMALFFHMCFCRVFIQFFKCLFLLLMKCCLFPSPSIWTGVWILFTFLSVIHWDLYMFISRTIIHYLDLRNHFTAWLTNSIIIQARPSLYWVNNKNLSNTRVRVLVCQLSHVNQIGRLDNTADFPDLRNLILDHFVNKLDNYTSTIRASVYFSKLYRLKWSTVRDFFLNQKLNQIMM